MKNISAFLKFFLSMIITMLICTAPAFAQSSNVVSIKDNITAPYGETVAVPIMIYNSTGAAAVGIKLSYNSSVVNVTGAAQGDFTSFFGFDNSSSAKGWVVINTFIIGSQLTGNVTVGTVTLEATGNPNDKSSLELEIIAISNMTGHGLSASADNGSFIVSDITPPSVTAPTADPSVIPNDGLAITRLSAAVSDESGIASVKVDLSPIQGFSDQQMTRTGNVWTFNVSTSAPPGTYELRVNATDTWGNSNTTVTIPLTVVEKVLVNRPPVLDPIGDKTINEGQTLTFTISAADPDGDPMIFSAANLPSGAKFNATTHTFSWKLGYSQSGTYPNVQFRVSDGVFMVTENITIKVNDVKRGKGR